MSYVGSRLPIHRPLAERPSGLFLYYMTPIPLRLRSLRPLGFAIMFAAVDATSGCDAPDDVLFVPPVVEPLEIRPGVFRITYNRDVDVVRGFTPDGTRIVYRSRGLAGFGEGWRILSVPVDGGQVHEEAAIYRQALRSPVGHLLIQGDRRVLVVWRREAAGAETCKGCPGLPVIGLSILRLNAADGAPLSAFPTRSLFLPNHASTSPCDHRVRLTPTEREVVDRGVDPYGPVIAPNTSVGVYSDGDVLWRFDLDDPTVPRDSIGTGAFPALSPDGTLLAAAIPLGADSVSDFCSFGLCPCIQETVTITASAWSVVVHDLTGGTVDTVASGMEPQFAPDGSRLLVRRIDALYWIDLSSGSEELIAGTSGAYAPRIAPDGSVLAFSTSLDGNPDVFFVRVQ